METRLDVYDIPLRTIRGEETTLREHSGKTLLIVNVASRCGLTPQYEGLERLHEEYAPRGFSVLGFPCNQFAEQEPGSAEEIVQFCSATYGITFPLYEKIEVNGEHRHPLFEELTKLPDNKGRVGDVRWNFEKFLLSPDGQPVARFAPLVQPDDPSLREAIESQLPA